MDKMNVCGKENWNDSMTQVMIDFQHISRILPGKAHFVMKTFSCKFLYVYQKHTQLNDLFHAMKVFYRLAFLCSLLIDYLFIEVLDSLTVWSDCENCVIIS